MRSIGRAFTILESIAEAGGTTRVSDLVTITELPLGTVYRLLRTLVDLGYLRQEQSRQYSLSPRLTRLAESRPL